MINTEEQTILLIEDNPGDIRLMKEMLTEITSINYSLISAETLKDGCEQIKNNDLILILLDLNLPDSTGKQTFDTVLKFAKGIPIVLVSGMQDEELSLSLIKEGAQDYITKKDLNSILLEKTIQYALIRKETEEVLKESEELRTQIMNSLDEGLLVSDLNDVIIDVNTYMLEMSGYKREELIGQTAYNIFMPPEEKERMEERLVERTEGKSEQYEILMRRKNGENIWVRITGSPLRNADGLIIGSVGVNLDITERKQAEEAIKKSEERYHTIFESTGTATMIVEEDLTISMLNNECISFTGYTSEELVGTKWINYVAPESLELMMKYDKLRREEPDKAPKKYEVKLVNKQGEVRNAILDIGMIPETKQKIVSILDITERKRAEEELLESEKRYLALYEQSPNGVLLMDVETGKVIEANEKAGSQLGYTREEFLSLRISDWEASEKPEETTKHIQEIIRDGYGAFETLHRTKSSEIRNVHIWTKILKTHNRDILYAIFQDITDHKRAEEELRESEERFRNVVENIHESLIIEDTEGKLIYANDEFCKIFGYMKEEFKDLTFKDYTSKESFEEISKRHYNRMKGIEQSEEFIYKGKRKDGSEIWIEARVSVLKENGKIVGTQSLERDITKRKQADEALIKSEERFKQVAESAGEWIWEVDTNGLYNYASPVVENILGYTPKEIVGKKHFYDLFYGDVKEETKNTALQLLASKQPLHEFPNRNIHKNGSIVWLSTSGGPILDNNGNLLGYRGADTNITERKQAAEKLKASEEKYKNLIETMPEGFYCSTPEGYFVDVNPALVKMFGYDSKEEMMKIYIPDDLYFSKDDREVDVYNIDFTSDSEAYRLRKKDGSEIWVVDYWRYIKDDSGNVVFHEGIMRDITESLKAQKAIIEAKDKAEEMSRLKSSFLANMSHEIRTPLNGILGFAQLLQEEVKDDEQLKCVKVIEKSGYRLLETLDLILNFSKLEAEMVNVRYSEINVSNVIDEVVESFEAMARNKKLVIEKIIKQKNLITKIDNRFLRHTLNNLVKNAVVYTKEGGITVTFDTDEKDMIIKVKDTGIGIAKEYYEVIFEPFRQESEGLGRNFEGTGLGLSITKRFVELMKGKIEVESEVGVGSTFTVRLPIIENTEIVVAEIKKEEPIKYKPLTLSKKKKLSILVVENDETNLEYILTILSKKYKTDSASDGYEAIEKAKKRVYDIILMDINLGKEIDGIMATQEIRKMKGYKDTPIVALTAYVREGDKEEFLAGGCTHFLGKPFTMKQLLELVEEIVQSKE